ncbi:hypothetical protein [Paratractidigestivibacter sp.]|uniref:hypothetical protein n=1 Tax=Paratractidigestivibacter sp. TaxID=2847316 RepID=UPI002ACB0B56|nr:hypothetical protein [Paratractidigestivibacter sp.]
MPNERDIRMRTIEYLKVIQPGLGNVDAATALGVGRGQVSEYRNLLADGFDFLGTRIHVDVGHNGKTVTTVHPLFLAANSAEVSVLLRVLLEYCEEHPDEYMSEVAEDLVEKIHTQLTKHGRELVDPYLARCGFGQIEDTELAFTTDDGGPCDPYCLTTFEKSREEIRVIRFGNLEGEIGRVTSARELRCKGRDDVADGLPSGCLHLLCRNGDIASIPLDEIADIQAIEN